MTSFEVIATTHLDAAYSLARWLTRDSVLAEDVVQDAMVRALTYFAGFRGDNPRAWLLQIVRNVALGKLGARVEPVSLDAAETWSGESLADTLTDGADGPETTLEREQDRRRVNELLNRLPVELRECLVLREIEDCSYKEIAHHRRSDRYRDVAAVACATNVGRPGRQAGEVIMSAELHCSQELLLQAALDGELDAAQSAALQIHLESCAICGPALSRLERARSLLAHAPRFAAPERLRAGVLELATAQPRSDVAPGPRASAFATRMRYMLSGAGVGALAAGVLTFILVGTQTSQVAESVVDNHLRAMQSPAHLVDVVSSEHHTVKPWFAGQIDFAPPVKDLEAFGYSLRGGRVDVVDGRNAAVLVYQAGGHTIDVSIQPRGGPKSAPAELRGFNVRRIEDGEFSVWAVSDLNARELDAFVEHWKSAE